MLLRDLPHISQEHLPRDTIGLQVLLRQCCYCSIDFHERHLQRPPKVHQGKTYRSCTSA
jgi:hypothetical protein